MASYGSSGSEHVEKRENPKALNLWSPFGNSGEKNRTFTVDFPASWMSMTRIPEDHQKQLGVVDPDEALSYVGVHVSDHWKGVGPNKPDNGNRWNEKISRVKLLTKLSKEETAVTFKYQCFPRLVTLETRLGDLRCRD